MFLVKLRECWSFDPNYVKEGKSQLVVGIGCTGGQHRSVLFRSFIFTSFKKGHRVVINHRDMAKNSIAKNNFIKAKHQNVNICNI